jgi:hypothetical protein
MVNGVKIVSANTAEEMAADAAERKAANETATTETAGRVFVLCSTVVRFVGPHGINAKQYRDCHLLDASKCASFAAIRSYSVIMLKSLCCNNAGSTRRATDVGDPTTNSFPTSTASTPTIGSGPLPVSIPLLSSSPSPEEPEPDSCPKSPPSTPRICSRASPVSTCRPLLFFLPFCLRFFLLLLAQGTAPQSPPEDKDSAWCLVVDTALPILTIFSFEAENVP